MWHLGKKVEMREEEQPRNATREEPVYLHGCKIITWCKINFHMYIWLCGNVATKRDPRGPCELQQHKVKVILIHLYKSRKMRTVFIHRVINCWVKKKSRKNTSFHLTTTIPSWDCDGPWGLYYTVATQGCKLRISVEYRREKHNRLSNWNGVTGTYVLKVLLKTSDTRWYQEKECI